MTEANVELALGNRCISVDHKTPVTNSTLASRSAEAGVGYISTRSIGYNHIDVRLRRAVGITVGNVAYSPDSVADYTLMLMLMAVRHAKSIICRADVHDYRLSDARQGAARSDRRRDRNGRIGAAVMDRLRASAAGADHDNRPQTRPTRAARRLLHRATSSRSTPRSPRRPTISSTARGSSS